MGALCNALNSQEKRIALSGKAYVLRLLYALLLTCSRWAIAFSFALSSWLCRRDGRFVESQPPEAARPSASPASLSTVMQNAAGCEEKVLASFCGVHDPPALPLLCSRTATSTDIPRRIFSRIATLCGGVLHSLQPAIRLREGLHAKAPSPGTTPARAA